MSSKSIRNGINSVTVVERVNSFQQNDIQYSLLSAEHVICVAQADKPLNVTFHFRKPNVFAILPLFAMHTLNKLLSYLCIGTCLLNYNAIDILYHVARMNQFTQLHIEMCKHYKMSNTKANVQIFLWVAARKLRVLLLS